MCDWNPEQEELDRQIRDEALREAGLDPDEYDALGEWLASRRSQPPEPQADPV